MGPKRRPADGSVRGSSSLIGRLRELNERYRSAQFHTTLRRLKGMDPCLLERTVEAPSVGQPLRSMGR